MPTPGSVLADIVDDPGEYVAATAATLRTAGLGLLIGTTAGTAVAVGVWWLPLSERSARPRCCWSG